MESNPFLNKDFLYKLNQYRHKEIYARIISLNFDEDPLETIEGKVTGGSINIDGNSAVRRTCNLSMVAEDVNIHFYYWNEANKFKLEIGVKNPFEEYQKDYPIIWFKQGTYVITSFNSSLTNTAYNISISGKDKMCLLNGDFGGGLPASIDFGSMDVVEDVYTKVDLSKTYETAYKANKYYIKNGDKYIISTNAYDSAKTYYSKDSQIKNTLLTLENIIREAIHTYGKEPYHNIIINDLADYGLELLEYRGERPLYLIYDEGAGIYSGMVLDEYANDYKVKVGQEYKSINAITPNTEIDSFNDDRTIFTLDGKKGTYSTTKVEYGHTIGYRQTDLTYPGELISSIGEALTAILDKIKNMLGPFEYFYDLDGRFVFQAKKIYANSSWSPIVNADDNSFVRDAVEESPYSYSFEDINLISQQKIGEREFSLSP